MAEGILEDVDELRQRVRALEARVAELLAVEAAAKLAGERLDGIIETLPGLVWEAWGEPSETRVNYVSKYIEAMLGYTAEEWLARPGFWLEIMHPDDRDRILRESRELFAHSDRGSQEYRWIARDGRVVWVDVRIYVIRDDRGAPIGRRGVTMDITARKRAEEDRARLSEELVHAQSALLAELSTPVVPVTDDIMVMPLVGRIDPPRAQRVLEVLLRGMHTSGARFAILDITGVPEVDDAVAGALLAAARAVSLLGAEAFLTGLRADVARRLVELGVDLGHVVTHGTLKAAVAHALRASARSARSPAPR